MGEALDEVVMQRPSMDLFPVHDIFYANVYLNGAVTLSRKGSFV